MKILLGVPEYPPHHIGGGGEVFKNLAEGYIKEGHDVVVIYGYYKAKWFENIKYYEQKGITFYSIPEIPYPKKLQFLRTVMPCNLKSLLKLKDIIKRENIEVAHLHGYGHLFIDSLARLCKKLNISYVFTNHGYPKIPLQKGLIIKTIWNIYMKSRGEFINKYAKNITCVSDYTQSEYINFQNKISVVPNGINLPNSFSNEQKDNIKNSFPYDKKILLSVGRITKYKGFQDVIKQMSNIPEYIYIIVGGDQDYQKELLQLAKKYNITQRIFFVGKVNRNMLDLYYQVADYIIIPSHVESFGLIGLEALINKRVVLHSGIQGLKYIEGSKNAYNFNNINSSIKSLLDKNIQYQNELFCEKYYRNNIVQKYIKIL